MGKDDKPDLDEIARELRRQMNTTTEVPLEHLSYWRYHERPSTAFSRWSDGLGVHTVHQMPTEAVVWAHYRIPISRTLNLKLEHDLEALLNNHDAFNLLVVRTADSTGQVWPGQFNGIAFQRVECKPGTMDRSDGWASSIVVAYISQRFLFTFAQPTVWLPDARGGDPAAEEAAIQASITPFEADGLTGILGEVEQTWLNCEGRTAADLALSVLCDVAHGLRALPTELRAHLDAVQEGAASRIVKLAVQNPAPRDLDGLGEVPKCFFALDRMTRRLEPLVSPGARTVEDGDSLFGAPVDHPLARLLIKRHRTALEEIQAVRAEAHAAADSFSSSVGAQQLVLAYHQRLEAVEERRREDRFARDATVIASLVLMPTLVASVFGANVPLPFGGTTAATITMLAAMVVLTAAMLVFLRWRHPRASNDSDVDGREPPAESAPEPPSGPS